MLYSEDDGASLEQDRLHLSRSVMHCYICEQPPSTYRPFNCLLCARDAIYQSRLRLAQTQLAQEAAATQVEQRLKAARATPSEPSKVQPMVDHSQHPIVAIDRIAAQKVALKERIIQVSEVSEHVRMEIARLKDDIANRGTANVKRRKDLAMARTELGRRVISDREAAEKMLGRIQHRWNAIHTRTIDSQLLLCQEAASLFGLHTTSMQNPPVNKTYAIGGLPIFSLKELNSEFCDFTPSPKPQEINISRRQSDPGNHHLYAPGPPRSPCVSLSCFAAPSRDDLAPQRSSSSNNTATHVLIYGHTNIFPRLCLATCHWR